MTQRHISHPEGLPACAAGQSARTTVDSPEPSGAAQPVTKSSLFDSPATMLQRAASALAMSLETGRVSVTLPAAADADHTLSFTFADQQLLDEARDAWKGYVLAMVDAPAPAAAVATHRAASDIGQALFADPTLALPEIARRIRAAREAAGAPVGWVLPDPPLPAQIPDNEATRAILGRPNFMCHDLAHLLRKRGDSIPLRAEDEQAAVLLFMLNSYLELPDRWKANVEEKIHRMVTEQRILEEATNGRS